MKIYNYSEARQNFSTVLNTALNENKKDLKSPLENIKGIKTNITMDEILKAIKQGREDGEYKKDTIVQRAQNCVLRMAPSGVRHVCEIRRRAPSNPLHGAVIQDPCFLKSAAFFRNVSSGTSLNK
jgi:hypothetical protein